MKFQCTLAPGGAGDARIGQHIRAITAILAELHVVSVRRSTVLEHADKLVTGPVEAAHTAAGGRLYPDQQRLVGKPGVAPGGEQLADVLTVHKGIDQRPIGKVGCRH